MVALFHRFHNFLFCGSNIHLKMFRGSLGVAKFYNDYRCSACNDGAVFSVPGSQP